LNSERKNYYLFKKIEIMKKVLLSAVAASFLLASCGPDVCDCVTAGKEMGKKMQEAGGDEDKMKKIEEEYKDIMEKCEKMTDGKSDEEKKELMEKAKECK
jgi:hypothetical protein